MRSDISFTVSPGDRQRLRAIAANPKNPQKHVWRARIILLSSRGLGTTAIMAATGKFKTCVWRWQARFMHEGVDALLRDRTQPGLPMKKGRAGTVTHDYKRRGTTTPFAALNVLDGTVIAQNMQRHRHQEFIRFRGHVPGPAQDQHQQRGMAEIRHQPLGRRSSQMTARGRGQRWAVMESTPTKRGWRTTITRGMGGMPGAPLSPSGGCGDAFPCPADRQAHGARGLREGPRRQR
jgi:hypothetical protein